MIFDEVNKAPESRTITSSNIYISSLGGKLNEMTDEDNAFAFKAAGWAAIFLIRESFLRNTNHSLLRQTLFTFCSFRVHFREICGIDYLEYSWIYDKLIVRILRIIRGSFWLMCNVKKHKFSNWSHVFRNFRYSLVRMVCQNGGKF